jgi:tetratricopeptide (TPR) repeat protein
VTAYWNRNDFGAALKLANVARAEAAASGDSKLHATSLIALGSVFQAAGDSARALDAYAQATTELLPGDRAGRARVLLYRGELLADQRQRALARPLLEEARTLAAELGAFSMMLAAEVNLTDIALGQHDLEGAERHLAGAEAAWLASGGKTPSQGILVNRAILARQRGDLAGALRAVDAAAAGDPPPENAWIVAHERGPIAATVSALWPRWSRPRRSRARSARTRRSRRWAIGMRSTTSPGAGGCGSSSSTVAASG